ncbi:hypothetical protein YK48G_11980 [Lentilactobacillus fungorum]|uniref:DUF3290 domain-containing protein n=1 Tax=Lentilactobacillus fungorum TaxID=2201250 RepID=A0ABQ3VXZ0_9LACO|nr:DUF3290 domain-containing protein [Lentilactobacillus fungorum]GHP13773.1 hypothetical protein YK48G_11980 [Lentilactobacillus fungorum]
MTFYTYNYLHTSQGNWQYARVIIISILVIVFMIFMIHYLRNQLDVKYKDLSIIVGTLLLLILAMQYNDFSAMQSATKQTGQITAVVKESAARLKVAPRRVSINSTSQNANLMIRTPKGFYRIDYNADGTQFILEKVSLHDPSKVTIKGGF